MAQSVRRTVELRFHDAQLDGEGGEFLFQRVTKLACDAFTFFGYALAFDCLLNAPGLPAPAPAGHHHRRGTRERRKDGV
jgi:hypothetical protein